MKGNHVRFMSEVTAIIIDNKGLCCAHGHYRRIIQMLKEILGNKEKYSMGHMRMSLDGYLFIDVKQKIIINQQSCFDPKKEIHELQQFFQAI